MKLLVVGIEGPETQRIRHLISDLELGSSVFLLHGLSEPELQWCYARCEELVVPSKTEGFGLPVAEALSVGCRVVCSDIPALREIGGAHCHYVALGADEEASLAAAIWETLQGPPRGPVSLPHLSAEVLSRQYLDLYQQLVPSAVSAQNTRSNGTPNTTPETPSFEAIPSPSIAERGGIRGCI